MYPPPTAPSGTQPAAFPSGPLGPDALAVTPASAGIPPVASGSSGPTDPNQLPPLTDEQRAAVKSWCADSDAQQKRYTDLWKKNVDAYAPPPEDLVKDRGDYEVNTNVDFRQAEQKKAQLWFETADIQLTPIEPLSDSVLQSIPAPQQPGAPGQAPPDPNAPPPPGQPQQMMQQKISSAIALHQTVLNNILGPDGVDAKRTMQSAILDVLVPAGWGVTHIGYSSYTRDVQTPDPMTGMAMSVKVPVYEEFFWSRLSPSSLMVPADFRSVDFDRAPWLAIKVRWPLSYCKREFGAAIPDDYKGGSKGPLTVRADDNNVDRSNAANSFDPYVAGIQFYYYEPTLNPDAFHPKRVCELVMLEGIEKEVRHRYSPYQSVDAEGRLTADSMIGYPIHILTLREVPDENHVPSDSSMTRPLTDELNQFRSQVLKSRDASIPYSFYDEDILPPEKIERITNGKYGPMIPVEGGRLNPAAPPIIPGNKPQLSRETYAGQDVIERDLERTLALGSNQTGATNPTRRTATEVATMQQSVDTRLAGEQQAVVKFFCAGVRKLDALVQRFSDRTQVVAMLGPDGVQTWLSWNKEMIAGRFLYTIKPDSQIHVDAAADRQQDLAFYNLTARDPYINRYELARNLAIKWGFNPDKIVQMPNPPGPPPPNVQIRIQAADLDPRLPQFPFAIQVLQQAGYQIDQTAVQNSVLLAGRATAMGSLPDDITPPSQSQPPHDHEHPGPAERTEPVDKHQSQQTGKLSGGGAQFANRPQ